MNHQNSLESLGQNNANNKNLKPENGKILRNIKYKCLYILVKIDIQKEIKKIVNNNNLIKLQLVVGRVYLHFRKVI